MLLIKTPELSAAKISLEFVGFAVIVFTELLTLASLYTSSQVTPPSLERIILPWSPYIPVTKIICVFEGSTK